MLLFLLECRLWLWCKCFWIFLKCHSFETGNVSEKKARLAFSTRSGGLGHRALLLCSVGAAPCFLEFKLISVIYRSGDLTQPPPYQILLRRNLPGLVPGGLFPRPTGTQLQEAECSPPPAYVTFQLHAALPYLRTPLFNSFPVEFLQFRKTENTESCHRTTFLLQKVSQICLFKKYESQPWLVWLRGLDAGLWTKTLPVRFPARAHAMFLSLSLKPKRERNTNKNK